MQHICFVVCVEGALEEKVGKSIQGEGLLEAVLLLHDLNDVPDGEVLEACNEIINLLFAEPASVVVEEEFGSALTGDGAIELAWGGAGNLCEEFGEGEAHHIIKFNSRSL